MILPQPRFLFLLIFLGCSALLISAIFIEPFKSMIPCPMCMMQRAIFFMIGLMALIGAIHGAKNVGQKAYAALTALISTVGAGVAMRQLWLQSLPEDQVPACGPGISYMLEAFPILDVIAISLRGTGDCAKVQWTFMNISIAGWSLFAFICICLISLSVLFKKHAK